MYVFKNNVVPTIRPESQTKADPDPGQDLVTKVEILRENCT
jgi:hypothetical protein